MENMMSESIAELAAALAKAQAEMLNAVEDKGNPHFKSSYASLGSVWNACRGALTKNGLSVVQTAIGCDEILLVTTLMHSSGQFIKSVLPIQQKGQKIAPQALGSAITYMRRYALSAIVGVAPGEDDDGQRADQSYKEEQVKAEKEREAKRREQKEAEERAAQEVAGAGFSEFVKKHELQLPPPGQRPSDKYIFMKENCASQNISEVAMINAMMKNEDLFERKFNAWMTKTTKL